MKMQNNYVYFIFGEKLNYIWIYFTMNLDLQTENCKTSFNINFYVILFLFVGWNFFEIDAQ